MAEVSFTNSYSAPLSVAYVRLDYDCQNECGQPWDVLGWIDLQPGDTQTRDNPTNNQYYYYYAEAADGAYWAGPYLEEVTNDRFEKCICLGVVVENGEPTNPYYDVGFRELDLSQYGGVNFIA
jgi:uncharacterized membrane protein